MYSSRNSAIRAVADGQQAVDLGAARTGRRSPRSRCGRRARAAAWSIERATARPRCGSRRRAGRRRAWAGAVAASIGCHRRFSSRVVGDPWTGSSRAECAGSEQSRAISAREIGVWIHRERRSPPPRRASGLPRRHRETRSPRRRCRVHWTASRGRTISAPSPRHSIVGVVDRRPDARLRCQIVKIGCVVEPRPAGRRVRAQDRAPRAASGASPASCRRVERRLVARDVRFGPEPVEARDAGQVGQLGRRREGRRGSSRSPRRSRAASAARAGCARA